MKYSPKQGPPACLTGWLSLENENWQPSYAALGGQVKADTHQALLQEQGYVCAYCGRAVSDDRSDSHIDHFWPQAHFPDLALDYSNFFVSCGPSSLPHPSSKALPQTCGDAKGNWFDHQCHIKPSDTGCEQRFTYGTTGKIFAVPGDQAASNMIQHLRLDDAALEYERGQIIQAVATAIDRGEITHLSHADERRFWRTPTDALGRLPNFGHVPARYLESEFPAILSDIAEDG